MDVAADSGGGAVAGSGNPGIPVPAQTLLASEGVLHDAPAHPASALNANRNVFPDAPPAKPAVHASAASGAPKSVARKYWWVLVLLVLLALATYWYVERDKK